jgi:ribonuclease R
VVVPASQRAAPRAGCAPPVRRWRRIVYRGFVSLRYSIRVLDHLSHRDYRPVPLQEMARQLRVPAVQFDEFRETLATLEQEKRLERGDDDRWRLPSFSDEVIGVYRQNARGFGFVEPQSPLRGGSLFIPQGAQADAVSGDRVRCEVNPRGRRTESARGPSGRVVEVLTRRRSEFTGTLRRRGRQWIVEPDGRHLREAVVVRDPFAKNASEGDKVVLELTRFPEEGVLGEGVILRVLGEAGRPDVETQAVIAAFGLRQEFPEAVIDEARAATRSFEREMAGPWPDREDLTQELIFTIDPPDAKDFDDAISIHHDRASGRWRLGVHIADVSHFVQAGSAMDEEARERGNSTYLPRLVLPMLPEPLSNGVCSLQEGVIRFTKSAFIEFDERGRVESQRLASTVIRSAKRMTYLEAQALIDGRLGEARAHARTETPCTEELLEALRLSDQLARLLEKRRRHDGMLTLDLPEVELVFDQRGAVVDAVPEDNAYTHKLIEMFMVEANEALARTFADLDVALIRRIHPEPTFADIENLRTFARLAKWKLPEEPTRRDIQALLESTRGTPVARAVHFAVLRTFTKASYNPALIGHFALASEHYTHFTSPIRRYPDLTVHRAMQAYLELTDNGRPPGGRGRAKLARELRDDPRVPDEAALVVMGQHCSQTEQDSEAAEHSLRTFLVLQLLKEKHLGDEFEGLVTGVTPTAVFVSLQRFLVDGVVKVADLSERTGRAERWALDESMGRLVATRSGHVIGLGDMITVQVVGADLSTRSLELRLVKFAERAATSRDGRPAEGGEAPAEVNRRKTRADGRVHGHKRGFKKGRRGRR